MSSEKRKPSSFLEQYFPFAPTSGQAALFKLFDDFLLLKKPRNTFLLKGYAGTGKTLVISTLVKILRPFERKFVLLAPTGRAAKVMAAYAKKGAYTIHKTIFKQVADPQSGRLQFSRQRNNHKNTVFVVDEASMINDQPDGAGQGLLHELVAYVFEDETANNSLLLVGDTAQLPPVHQSESPALNEDVLSRRFRLQLASFTLDEVLRQEADSGILLNATHIRQQIAASGALAKLQTKGFPDIYRMTRERLEDGLRYAYDKFGMENTTIICRSNRTATQYNEYIRRQIMFSESEIDAGDLLMVVKNDYFWLNSNGAGGFLANGEFAEVRKVRNTEEQHGFRFADLSLQLVDYPDHPIVEAKVHLGTLHAHTPNMGQEENKQLYEAVLAGYADEESEREQYIQAKKDPYLNALQVKFAYALTCHKSQGGQWEAAFIDMGFVQEEQMDLDFQRWLYTAVTRASKELFLINFPPQLFV